MWQMLLLLAAAVVAASARPGPGELDVEPGSLQPYHYQYEVNVPETGDQKSHTEERDETGVVVGNYQVVDPNGDLRKLFYRVEGNSGFVITDQQVMRGFADPPPAPETYSNRQVTKDDFQGGDNGGQLGLVSDSGAGTSQQVFSDQSSAGDAGQLGDGAGNGQSSSGNGGDSGFFGFNNFPSRNGGSSFSEEGSFSSGESGGSSGGDSFEGGSFGGGSSGDSSSSFKGGLSEGQQQFTSGASGESSSSSVGGLSEGQQQFTSGASGESSSSFEGGLSEGQQQFTSGASGESSSFSEGGLSEGQQQFTSGASGTDGQNDIILPKPVSRPITSQASKAKQVEPFEFHGPAFTFSIQRIEPNRFEVKEKIIGHEVEFNTHGGRSRRFAADLP